MPFQVGDLVRIKSNKGVGGVYIDRLGVVTDIKNDDDPDGTIDVKFGPSIDIHYGHSKTEFLVRGRITRFAEEDLQLEQDALSILAIEDYTHLLHYLDPRYTTPIKRCICEKPDCGKPAKYMIWINEHGSERKVSVCGQDANKHNGSWTESFMAA